MNGLLAILGLVGIVVVSILLFGAPKVQVREWLGRERRRYRTHRRSNVSSHKGATAVLAVSLVSLLVLAVVQLGSAKDIPWPTADSAVPSPSPSAFPKSKETPAQIHVPKVNSNRDPGTGHGNDRAAKKACEQLSKLIAAAKRGSLTTSAVKKTVRGWGDLQVRNHAYISADAHFLHDDVFLSPPASLSTITHDLGLMKRDCARAGFG